MQVPRIIPVLALLAILVYVHDRLPGVVETILGLIVLYVVLTHVVAAERLFGDVPAGLARLFPVQGAGGTIFPGGRQRPGVT